MPELIPFDDYRDQWLEEVVAGGPSTTELGHRFARKLLTQWRDIESSSDDLIYCDGAGDGGIDIAYLDRGELAEDDGSVLGATWYLVQSKYGSALQGSNTIVSEGRKVIDTLAGQRTQLSSLAAGVLERLTNFMKGASDQDRIVLVFATVEPLTSEETRALEDVKTIGRERLGGVFDVEAISVQTIYLRTLDDIAATKVTATEVPLEGELVEVGGELLVGAVSLPSLYGFLKSFSEQTQDLDWLYERNVRRFLGNRRRVNKLMQQTLQNTPELFGLYNNGITIVVTGFEHDDENGIARLVDPYVVNGCQTTRTIWEVFHRRVEAGSTGANEELESWLEKANRGVVVTKVVRVGTVGESLLQNITRYTNSQNSIQEKDFLALNQDFRVWASQMADQYGIFLEIQRGGWESQRVYQKQHPETRQFTEMANAFDLLKVYGAGWLGEAGAAFGRNSAFIPNGPIFKRIMNVGSDSVPFGMEDLYAAYRLQQAANRYQFGRGGPTTRRQTRFLFYMVALHLLKGILIREQITEKPTPHQITRALLALFDPANPEAVEALLQAALEVIDEYLTQGTDESVFNEPAYVNAFNYDLNGYLKWEQLGKSDQVTPRLYDLLADTTRSMGRAISGSDSARKLVAAAIKAREPQLSAAS